jgi:ATP-dependent DNA helicase RecG
LTDSFEPYDQSVLKMNWASEKTSEKTKDGIVRLLSANANMTITELSVNLEKTTRTIERTLSALQAQGKVQRIGGDKGGYWKVLKC